MGMAGRTDEIGIDEQAGTAARLCMLIVFMVKAILYPSVWLLKVLLLDRAATICAGQDAVGIWKLP